MAAAWTATGGNFTPARIVLIEARNAGVPFEAAGPVAVRAVDADDRATLRETSGAWKAEYEGRRSWGGDLIAALAVLEHDAGRRSDARIVA